jgi:hypothetical protein
MVGRAVHVSVGLKPTTSTAHSNAGATGKNRLADGHVIFTHLPFLISFLSTGSQSLGTDGVHVCHR